ncbi:hypothetical protein [Flavobacterium sp. 102]|uniref:hypothetical protein n=1 Tax=Flavobacterium sp. 102 TaxID=2135623 RepID=UPI000EAB81B7|nr:hypothetical protein [Flavobacterium sp. 102]RKS03060.1 hypothetical protein C8C84_2801 [Flavobacterium sp. 102]
MFEKITYLKDFIIYLIPGILICYFSLNIFNLLFGETLTTVYISADRTLSFIGIIFSFLVGFLICQLQIMFYNRILREKFRKMRTINETQYSEELKDVLIKRIKKVFKINNVDKNQLLNDNLIIFSCLNYVKIHTNDESQEYINRSSYLSSFATTLIIPINLGILNLLLHFKLSAFTIILAVIISTIIVFLITRKIAINFRDEWFRSIFRQFLILSNKK